MAKKALFFAPSAYPLGGVAVWLNYTCIGLQELGWEVGLALPDSRFHDVTSYLAHHHFDRVSRLVNAVGSEAGRIGTIRDELLSQRPDIVLSVNIPDLYRAVRELPRDQNKQLRVAATVHGVLPQLFDDLNAYDDVIDDVIVTNRLTTEMVLGLTNFPAERVHYAPYGVELVGAAVPPDSETPLRILYSGRIENDQKRCADIVEIARVLQATNLKFVLRIAGDGPYRKELLHRLADILAPEQLEYLGFVAPEQLAEIAYQRSDCLLLTSDWETGPIVVWEAMANGLAVVSSQYKGCKLEGALRHDENCLLFPVGDAAAAAAQLQRLTDIELQRRLRGAGLQLVKSRYTRERSVAAWDTALHTILQRQPRNKQMKKNHLLPRGRLDRLLGVRWSTRLRQILRWPVTNHSAGDEWPHTHAALNPVDVEVFYKTLAELE